MKHIAKIAAVVLGISAATVANAQSSNDPSYSIHNYKHPNKAAKMKAIADAQPERYLQEIKPQTAQEETGLTASANYKGMSASKSNTRKFAVSNSSEDRGYFLANTSVNYKQQFPARTKKIDRQENRTEQGPVAVQ